MTAAVLPDGWATMRAAVYAWAAGVAGDVPVIWEGQNAYAPDYPYVTLAVTSPPSGDRSRDEVRHRTEGGGWDVAAAEPVEAAQYVLTFDGTSIAIVFNPAPTEEELQTALLAAIADDPTVDALVTAEAFEGGVRIRPRDPTAEVVVEANERLEVTELLVEETHGNREWTVQVEVLGARQGTDQYAAELEVQGLAMSLRDSLVRSDVAGQLRAAGVAIVEREPMAVLPEIVGVGWQARCAFAVRFRSRSITTTVLSWIETAGVVDATAD